MNNKPKEIVLCEDTSTSVIVSERTYGGSTQGPTSSSTSGLADQGKSMESVSVSIEVNSYGFLPEMNYPLRELDNCPKTRAARASAIQTKQLLFNSYDGYQNANCKWDSNQVQTATYS